MKYWFLPINQDLISIGYAMEQAKLMNVGTNMYVIQLF